MDYKEKLEKAMELYPTANADQMYVLECLFPELAESEDERIRKALIKFHKSTIDIDGIKGEQIIAWLEKQGTSYTKRDVDNAFVEGMVFAKDELEKQGEPKFKVGDILKHNKANIVCKVLSANVGFYSLISILGGDEMELCNVEKNFHLWTIQDAKDGDVLACGDKVTDCPFIFHNLTEELNPRSYCGINKLLHFQDNDENGGFWCQSYEVQPATKEQRDFLFAKMKEEGYEWDAEKKKLKLLVTNGGDFESEDCEQKTAWSEEDEVKINRIVAYLENLNVADNDILLKDVDWLKSIKQRIKGE